MSSWKKVVGKADGIKLCVVDGDHVRTRIGDVDFALGGNHERYTYIPDDEVWAENSNDLYETFGHEIMERALMKKGGSYDDSHKCALAWEMAVRGIRKPCESMHSEGRHHRERPLSKKAFIDYMRKSADIQPTSFESNQDPDVDTQGAVVDPRPVKRHPLPQLVNATTSAEDDKVVNEPRSPTGYDG